MRIEVKGRNVSVGDELRERIEKRFQKIAKQVSELALAEVELTEERNPRNATQSQIAEITLHLKGVTLRTREATDNMVRSINAATDDLARQVKRHRDKRRKRRESRAAAEAGPGPLPETPGESLPAI
jgi:putative sigma-54 modulation protein